MSDNRDRNPEEDEGKIPVFTVIKNGAILKNIFIIKKSPSPELDSIADFQNVENPDGETDEILIAGRHPDCNIVLMHPSISRFHLQINSKPSIQKLFVTDLSSVHGTWVSERKIEPGFRTELNEGDTIRVGCSTRLYRLHWVPLSCAYDTENPFVSPSDIAKIEEDENLEKLSQNEDMLVTENGKVQKKIEENFQEMNSISALTGEIQCMDSILECFASLFADENSGLIVKKEVLSEMSEKMNSLVHGGNEETEGPFTNDNELNLKAGKGFISQSPEYYSAKESSPENKNTDLHMTRLEVEPISDVKVNSVSSAAKAEVNSLSEMLEETETESLLKKDSKLLDTFLLECVSFLSIEDRSDTDNEQVNKENQTPVPLLPALNQPHEQENQDYSIKNQLPNVKDGASTEMIDEMDSPIPSIKDCTQHEFISESVNSSLSHGDILSEIVDSKTSEFASPASKIKSSEKKSSTSNIWSRRCKTSTALQLHTSPSRRRIRRLDTNASIQRENQENIDSKSITRACFSGVEVLEEDVFTPEKENHTPNTSLLKFSKKKGKEENSPVIASEEDMFVSSDKENRAPKFFQQRKSARKEMKLDKDKILNGRKERIPFQTLVANSPGKSICGGSGPTAAVRLERVPFQSLLLNSPVKIISEGLVGAAGSSNSINYSQKSSPSIDSVEDGRGRWTIIADTTSLIDKESRQSLQLLQGLKGTRLIIPRMVIRELDSLNRYGSLFKRTTEASLALKWIQECMVKTKWWVQVQSSVEDAKPIAPTPPASPVSRFSEGSGGFPSSLSFSAHGSLYEIVSPTPQDSILDCALSYRKMNNDGQLVLLSNEATLQIKAMAEGLVCETAKVFRDSLVNPFSDRFLWADSSPRGQTWSVLDDIVLKEKYYRSPSKKSTKEEVAKGLKLILLHNSHYNRQIGLSSH